MLKGFRRRAKLKSVTVDLKLPYVGGIQGTWEPDAKERDAAWEMYVELITRIATVRLEPQEGLLREALTSLYTLFERTRHILRTYGPDVAIPKGSDDISFGYLAVAILNTVLRPLLAKWHPGLLSYEGLRQPDVSPVEYERRWEKNVELRGEVEEVRAKLMEYGALLADVSGVPSLMIDRPPPSNGVP